MNSYTYHNLIRHKSRSSDALWTNKDQTDVEDKCFKVGGDGSLDHHSFKI